jgi:hypothetical protein
VDFVEKLGDFLDLVDDDGLVQYVFGLCQELLPQEGRILGKLDEEIRLKEVVNPARWEARPEQGRLAGLARSPEERGLLSW